jgi:hypothetical protein
MSSGIMYKILNFWRFLTIMCVALSLGAALAHLYELPAKINFDGELWLELLHRLYPAFGTAGAVFEVGAVVAAIVLTLLVRHRAPGSFAWSLAGALCLLVSHAAFWIWVAPVNAELGPLTVATLPADWMELRDQWEYTHAARAILQLTGLAAIVMSLIVELPPDWKRT